MGVEQFFFPLAKNGKIFYLFAKIYNTCFYITLNIEMQFHDNLYNLWAEVFIDVAAGWSRGASEVLMLYHYVPNVLNKCTDNQKQSCCSRVITV